MTTHRTNIQNGNATITLQLNLTSGTYNITARNIENNQYSTATASGTLTIEPLLNDEDLIVNTLYPIEMVIENTFRINNGLIKTTDTIELEDYSYHYLGFVSPEILGMIIEEGNSLDVGFDMIPCTITNCINQIDYSKGIIIINYDYELPNEIETVNGIINVDGGTINE